MRMKSPVSLELNINLPFTPLQNNNKVNPKGGGHLKGRNCEQKPSERKSTKQKCWSVSNIIPSSWGWVGIQREAEAQRWTGGTFTFLKARGGLWNWSRSLTQTAAGGWTPALPKNLFSVKGTFSIFISLNSYFVTMSIHQVICKSLKLFKLL